jgi:hypothetical protein
MDDRWGPSSGSATDRLAALRPPAPDTSGAGPQGRGKRPGFSRELILAAVLILLGACAVLVLVGRDRQVTVLPADSTVVENVHQGNSPVAGTALVAALVDQGNFPPEMEEGDSVVVIVTPTSSSDGTTRQLPGVAIVHSVAETNSGSYGAVVTLVSTETVAREIADAGSVHLAIVAGVDR